MWRCLSVAVQDTHSYVVHDQGRKPSAGVAAVKFAGFRDLTTGKFILYFRSTGAKLVT